MSEDIKTYRLLLTGRVQGVGFRYFAVERAAANDVNGYVKNTVDNKVEVVCQGKSVNIEQYISDLKKGPSFAHITEFRIETVNSAPDYLSFEIKY